MSTVDDYFATQRTGTACAPFNCAAASGAMGLAAGTANATRLTADQFRSRSGASCVPGAHSASGGLFISDVKRVFDLYGVPIDYGQTESGYTRWPAPTLSARCGKGEGAVLLGDYDALPKQYRASATFLGDHSTWVHDYRESDKTICWHDPLRSKPIRIPISAAIAYWQKPGSPIRGYAGFVKVKTPLPDTGTEEPMGPLEVTSTTPMMVDPIEGRTLVRADGTWGPGVSNIGPRVSAYEVLMGATRCRSIVVNSGGEDQLLFVRNSDCASIKPVPPATGGGDQKHKVAMTKDGAVIFSTDI